MATVHDILSVKGSHVHTVSPAGTVLEATVRMNQHKIGAMVVTVGDRVVGMFTERDVLRRVVAEQRDPAAVTVGEVMTSEVISCGLEDDLDDVGLVMQQKRVRHLPVCDRLGRLLGLVSIGDLNAQRVSTQEQTIHYLNDYIYGRV